MTSDLEKRYIACMLLHAVGDAMGYKNGKWEFKFSGVDIHEELAELGGIAKLELNPSKIRLNSMKFSKKNYLKIIIKVKWKLSDDTILHLAVAECLVENADLKATEELFYALIDNYKKAMTDMTG